MVFVKVKNIFLVKMTTCSFRKIFFIHYRSLNEDYHEDLIVYGEIILVVWKTPVYYTLALSHQNISLLSLD